MKFALRLIHIILVLTFVTVSAWAQTTDDLKSKYGAPFNAYEIRPGIMMTVKLDDNGYVSMMRIERHAAPEAKVYLDTTIPAYLSKEIVDELVPVAERGARGEFSGLLLITGGGGTSTDDYENVAVTYYTNQSKKCNGLVAIVINWKNRAHKQKSF